MFTRTAARRRPLGATVVVVALGVLAGVLVPLGSTGATSPAIAVAADLSQPQPGATSPAPSTPASASGATDPGTPPSATTTPEATAPSPAQTGAASAAAEPSTSVPSASASAPAEAAPAAPSAAPASPATAAGSEAEAEAAAHAAASQTAQPRAARALAAGAGVSGCSYADAETGAYAGTLCWLDFSAAGSAITTRYIERNAGTDRTVCTSQGCRTTWHFDSMLGRDYGFVTATGSGASRSASETAAATDLNSKLPTAGNGRYGNVGAAGFKPYPITVTLEGGYTLTAGLTISSDSAAGRAVSGWAFPTWPGAFLGNVRPNERFYTGVRGRPALYHLVNGGNKTTTITLSNVTLSSNGTNTKGFSVVVADAESTDSGESIAWSQQNGSNFSWLPNIPGRTDKPGIMGNACPQRVAPLPGSTSATAECLANANSDKTGTPMLQVSPGPSGQFSITATLGTGGGLQGTAFGIIIARAQASAQVVNRIVGVNGSSLDPTNFGVTIDGGSTASTGATATEATTGGIPVLLNAQGTRVEFATSASGSLAASYTASWRCFKTDPNSTVRTMWPSATGSSPSPPPSSDSFSLLRAGQFVHCTVTYTPPYLTLVKQVQNGSTGASNAPADWVLSGSGPSSRVSGSGATVRTAVAVGTYTLAEAGPTNPWVHGYRWTGLSCTATPNSGSTSVGSLTTTPGSSSGTIATGSIPIARGNNVTCTFVNTAQSTLTLVKRLGSLGTAQPTDFTLTATAPDGALAVRGTTGSAGATGVVTPGVAYVLGEQNGPATYVQDSVWSCVNRQGGAVAVSAGSVSVPTASQVTCTVTNATARLTLLKHMEGFSSTLEPRDFKLTAAPATLDGLVHQVVVGNDEVLLSGPGANTFDVRPGHEYTLSESSRFAYLGLSLQVYPGGYPASGNFDDSLWEPVEVNTVRVEANQHAVYRFVNAAPVALTLPLTGGIGADTYLFGGAGLLLLGLLVIAIHLARTRIRSDREARLT